MSEITNKAVKSPATPSSEREVEGLRQIAAAAADKLQSLYFNSDRKSATRDACLAGIEAITALLSRISPSPVNTSGRDPSGQAAQQSPSPDGLGPSGEHPSRVTLDGIEVLLFNLAAHSDCELQDRALFQEAGIRLREYQPEARRIISETAGQWSAWSEEELDSDPSDPLVGRTTEWFVGFWRKGEPEADARVRVGSRLSDKGRARGLATYLNEMVSLVDCARDQRAEREDGDSRPRPEAASPVRAAEAPSPTPSLQTQGAVEKTREAERILVTVNRSGCLPGCMMPDGAEPCKAFQEQDEAIRAALALFQNALAEADRALQSPPDRREEGSRGDEWQPIATAPTDVPYTADMPDEADGDGMGWAISDDDDRLLFLVWWEQESAGRWTVTKWHPLPASPRPSQKEQGDA